MKKVLAVLLSVLMVVSMLASCKGEDGVQAKKKVEVESAEQLVELRTQASKDVDSLSCVMSGAVDVEAMGEELKIDFAIDMDYDNENKLYYMDITAQAMDEDVHIEMYMDMGENPATYVCYEDTWVKQVEDEETAQLYADLFEMSENTELDMFKYMKNAEYTEEDGCYVLTYDMQLDIIDMLEQYGLSMEDLTGGEEIDASVMAIVAELMSDLGSVPCTERLDVYTLLPVSMEMDMTECVSGLVDKVLGIVVSMYGEGMTAEELGISVSVNEVAFDMEFDSYNDVTVVIPEEALNAEEVEV